MTTTAVAAAVFSNDNPAITIHPFGRGYGIAYAFFPGFHYQQSANWDDSHGEPSHGTILPYGWGKIERDIIVVPAGLLFANTPKPIALNQEMVETCLLESEEGIAIVLLNWSGMRGRISNLTMTINNSTTPILSKKVSIAGCSEHTTQLTRTVSF